MRKEQAMNNLKWLKKYSEKGFFKKDFGGYKRGWSGGYTAAMALDKRPLFSGFIKA